MEDLSVLIDNGYNEYEENTDSYQLEQDDIREVESLLQEDKEVLSSNEIHNDTLVEIKNILERMEENERDIQYNVVLSGNDVNDSDNTKTVSVNTVSDNILTKPLNEYTTSESISVLLFLEILIGSVIYLIRKGLPTWH